MATLEAIQGRFGFEPAMDRTFRWAVGPDGPELHSDIHVWAVGLDRPHDELARLRGHLDREEMEKAARYHRPRDVWRSVACRGVLRELLGRYSGRAPGDIRFRYGRHGKPFLSGPSEPDIRFNVSHTGGMALMAVARGTSVGIDVERVQIVPHLEELASRFFSESEKEALLNLPRQERTTAFYRAWTRKEAVIKALGQGLSRPLDSFDVTLGPHQAARVQRLDDGRRPERWQLEHLAPAPDVIGALAHPGETLTVRCWRLPQVL